MPKKASPVDEEVEMFADARVKSSGQFRYVKSVKHVPGLRTDANIIIKEA
jgi:hypothetical protein